MSLNRIDAGLFTLDSYFLALGCKGSIRMTLMHTGEGLLLHSPVCLSEEDVVAVRKLGEVRAIIAPNLFHHKYLRDCGRAFPSARVLIPDGLEAKIGPVPRAEPMKKGKPLNLPPEIEYFVFDRHRCLRETLLFHRPTRTLVTADLLYNYHREQNLCERTFFKLLGCYGSPSVPIYHRVSIRDRKAVRELIATVDRWQPRRIIMSHGRIVESDRSAALFATAWRPFA